MAFFNEQIATTRLADCRNTLDIHKLTFEEPSLETAIFILQRKRTLGTVQGPPYFYNIRAMQ